MRSKLALLLLLVCSSIPIAEAASQADNIIIPGERVGLITRNTTESELKALLPQNQIKRVLYDIGEGNFRCATEVFPNSEKAVTIIWGSDEALYEPYKDEKAYQKKCDSVSQLASPESVIIDKEGTFWRTENTIRVGVSLVQLEKAHGKPLTFSICECDYGGNVINWPIPKLFIHLDYSNDLQNSLEHFVSSRDHGVKSSDVPEKIKSTITIDKIEVYFDDPYAEHANSPKAP